MSATRRSVAARWRSAGILGCCLAGLGVSGGAGHGQEGVYGGVRMAGEPAVPPSRAPRLLPPPSESAGGEFGPEFSTEGEGGSSPPPGELRAYPAPASAVTNRASEFIPPPATLRGDAGFARVAGEAPPIPPPPLDTPSGQAAGTATVGSGGAGASGQAYAGSGSGSGYGYGGGSPADSTMLAPPSSGGGFDGGGMGGDSFATGADSGISRAEGLIPTIGDKPPFFGARLVPNGRAGGPGSNLARLAGGGLATAAELPFPGPNPGPDPGTPTYGAEGSTGQLFVRQATLKISDNQTPRPTDRIYYNANYFNGLNEGLLGRFGLPYSNIQVISQMVGVEKTILGEYASVGVRLPYNIAIWDEGFRGRGVNRQSEGLGDLSAYFKAIALESEDGSDLISVGLNVTAPTGTSTFAGSGVFRFNQTTRLQPFAGYLFSAGDLFVQGFVGADIPVNGDDTILLYNTATLGWYLYRSEVPGALISAVIPTVEAHVNTPVGQGNAGRDPLSDFDMVNLGIGGHVQLFDTVFLSAAYVTPLTGPRPMDYEVVAGLNILFGSRRAVAVPPTFP